jgi:hypothetical protein
LSGEGSSSGFGFRDAASIGVGFLPVVGTVQSLVELVTGQDYISGQPANRWLSAIGLVAGLIPGGKAATKVGGEAVGAIGRTTGAVADVSRVAGRVDNAATAATLVTSKAVEAVNLSKRVVFNGTEVRAVRDLSHVSDIHLEKMAMTGVNPYNQKGERLIYHHLDQKSEVVVMIPQKFHAENLNPNLHPYGNAKGTGLGGQARIDYNKWRLDYNREIAIRELERRAAGGATTQTIFPNYKLTYP